MRIYRRAAFMEIPAGTLYSKGKPHYFEGLHIKGDTINHEGRNIDFGQRDLVSFEFANTDEFIQRWEEMIESGASYPMEDCYGRDGCFDDEDLFLVWERADLEEMQRVMAAAIAVCPTPPDGKE